jgi:hypothetical protein
VSQWTDREAVPTEQSKTSATLRAIRHLSSAGKSDESDMTSDVTSTQGLVFMLISIKK